MRKLLSFFFLAMLTVTACYAEDRISQGLYGNVASEIIASYSRNGIIDVTGLARALETEGNAVIAGEVLRKLVKVESVGNPRRVIRTNINTLDVASVVARVSDPQFLQQIQTCLKQQPKNNGGSVVRIADPLNINMAVSYLIHSRLFAMDINHNNKR